MFTRSIHPIIRIIVAASALMAATSAHAIFRAYLSLTGSGVVCSLAAPCRLLPEALAAVDDGGEIWMLNSANYNTGPVVINKSVKILAIPGEMGSVLANGGGDAIVINAPGKDVTLRNLFVLHLNGVNGINIQNAAAVHIEKTTVHDFSGANSHCIVYNSAAVIRMYVVDSFLRHCRVAISAHATAVPPQGTPRSSLVIDNTRIERASGTQATGILQKGCIDVVFRNSTISRFESAIQMESLIADCFSHLQVDGSNLARNTTAIRVTSATVNGHARVAIAGTQILNSGDGIIATNSAIGSTVHLQVSNSAVGFTGGNGVTLANSAADTNSSMTMNLANSQLNSITGSAVDLSSTNGSQITFVARDSSFAHATRMVKTAGTGAGRLRVSLIRSNLQHATFAVDHGFGTVRLDGSHFTQLINSFVNSGSGDIRSLGNNWLTNFDNASGLTYITPTIIAPI